MKMRNFGSLLTVSFLLCFASGCWGQATENGREFHWKGKLAPEQVVVVRNVNGDISAEGLSGGDEVEVTAIKSGRDADQVKVQMLNTKDGVIFCTVYPGWFSSNDCESHWNSSSHNHARVDFTVRMPQNLRFTGHSVNGTITAESMGRYVDAASVNGKVRIQTQSWAAARSVNGSIEARLGRTDWPGTLEFKTVNGSIRLELPSSLNADVDFTSVNGHLDCDFPITTHGSLGRRAIHGTIGNGGRELELRTVNGSVELRKAGI